MTAQSFDVARLRDETDWSKLRKSIDPKGNIEVVGSVIAALKSVGTASVIVEKDYLDQDFSADFSAFYSKVFRRYRKLCNRLHFFSADVSPAFKEPSPQRVTDSLQNIGDQGHYLGYIVVRPLKHAPLGRVVIKPPGAPVNMRSNLLVRADYEAHVLGARFVVTGTPLTQQDSRVGACAQAAIWMVGRHFHTKHRGAWFAMADITEAASKPADFTLASSLPAGSRFLSGDNMVRALQAMGRQPLMFVATRDQKDATGFSWPAGVRPERIVNQYIDSGIPVILGLTFPNQQIGHAIVATGHTLRTLDPGTIFDQLPSRADFVEAFLVNDDQRGTHLRMPIKPGSTVGETPYDFRTNVRYIIIALPQKVYITGEIAEQLGWGLIKKYENEWPTRKAKNKHKGSFPVDLGDEFVAAIQANRVFARTYLTYGWKYQQRMMRNSVSDAVKAALLFHNFPRYVWVTEFGTFDSFNHINIEDCQIYSHLTVDATSSDYWEGRAIFHAPGVVHRWYHDPKDERNDYAEAESVTLNDVAYRPKIGGQL